MISQAPSLTVFVMCRNHERYLESCLRAILEADQPCQLLFVDNGSRDGSVAIARATLRDAPSHISHKVLALDPELPLCRALNVAHAECTGEFIKLISGDDRIGPNMFSTFRHLVATSDSQVGVWLAGSVIIDENDNVLRQTYSPALFGSPDDGPAVRLHERQVIHSKFAPPYSVPSIFYRRKTYDELGGFDERFRFEDRPFLFNVVKSRWAVLVHPYNNTFYRVHAGGTSADPAWMAEARVPMLLDHTIRATWRNKPVAFYHLARNVRVVARDRWRKWRARPE